MTAELSLSIPVYNEEGCIERVAKDLLEEFASKKIDLELILVNNGSIDSTAQVIDKLSKEFPKNIVTVHLKKNAGIGGGILAGLEKASGKFVGYTCADGQITPHDTYRVFMLVRKGEFHIGKTIRLVRNDGIYRKILSKGFFLLSTSLFWNRFDDINGYPVIMNAEIFKKLKIKSKSYMFNLELLLKARKAHLTVGAVEAPFLERYAGRAHVNFATPVKFMKELWELKKSRIIDEELDF